MGTYVRVVMLDGNDGATYRYGLDGKTQRRTTSRRLPLGGYASACFDLGRGGAGL